ncbi:MAG TPA: septum formation protein Maf [Bacteroidales bacterium]|nr:septum formation protein Maf [Bacteroidales bacterium]
MYIQQLNRFRFILGSKSPRRQHLLRKLGLKFHVLTRQIEEDYPMDLIREQIPLYLCERKSKAFNDVLTDDQTVLITADTIVWINNMNIGKPGNEQEAAEILSLLSGERHEVLTGVCLRSKSKAYSFYVCSEVFFNPLRDAEIDYYIKHYKPYDKAGAYGIQEWIGYIGIDRINGSFYNVMGLPVQRLYNELLSFCGVL